MTAPTAAELNAIESKFVAIASVHSLPEAVKRLGTEYRHEEGPRRRSIWLAFQCSDRAKVAGGRLEDGVRATNPAHVEAIKKHERLMAGVELAPTLARL